jgi:hypothetical protein
MIDMTRSRPRGLIVVILQLPSSAISCCLQNRSGNRGESRTFCLQPQAWRVDVVTLSVRKHCSRRGRADSPIGFDENECGNRRNFRIDAVTREEFSRHGPRKISWERARDDTRGVPSGGSQRVPVP